MTGWVAKDPMTGEDHDRTAHCEDAGPGCWAGFFFWIWLPFGGVFLHASELPRVQVIFILTFLMTYQHTQLGFYLALFFINFLQQKQYVHIFTIPRKHQEPPGQRGGHQAGLVPGGAVQQQGHARRETGPGGHLAVGDGGTQLQHRQVGRGGASETQIC